MQNHSTIAFTKRIKEEGIRISVKNNELDIVAPKGKLTQEILAELKHRKSEILSYLAGVYFEKNTIEAIKDLKENYPLSGAQHRLWGLRSEEHTSELQSQRY